MLAQGVAVVAASASRFVRHRRPLRKYHNGPTAWISVIARHLVFDPFNSAGSRREMSACATPTAASWAATEPQSNIFNVVDIEVDDSAVWCVMVRS